ncbi:MAG: hypothetical protein RBT68_06885 [Spirochaetia bacterium]|jgi:hypothetical protein|nr:hypothetical protein [Spirochaetia bacterium]
MADIFQFQHYFDIQPPSPDEVELMTFEEAAAHDIRCLRQELSQVIQVVKSQNDYNKHLVNAVQSLDERIETTNRRIDNLAGLFVDEIRELRNRVEALESNRGNGG